MSKSQGHHGIHHAAEHGQVVVLKNLLKIGDEQIDAPDKNGNTPLMIACMRDQNKTAMVLLELNASLECLNKMGETALICAVKSKNLVLVDAILNHFNEKVGVDVSSPAHIVHRGDRDGCTPLMFASTMGVLEIVDRLVSAGADVNATDNFESTPMIYACLSKHLSVVRYLMSCQADMNCQAKGGSTPLIFAVRSGQIELAKLLIDAQVNLDLFDADGRTAFDYATDPVKVYIQKSKQSRMLQQQPLPRVGAFKSPNSGSKVSHSASMSNIPTPHLSANSAHKQPKGSADDQFGSPSDLNKHKDSHSGTKLSTGANYPKPQFEGPKLGKSPAKPAGFLARLGGSFRDDRLTTPGHTSSTTENSPPGISAQEFEEAESSTIHRRTSAVPQLSPPDHQHHVQYDSIYGGNDDDVDHSSPPANGGANVNGTPNTTDDQTAAMMSMMDGSHGSFGAWAQSVGYNAQDSYRYAHELHSKMGARINGHGHGHGPSSNGSEDADQVDEKVNEMMLFLKSMGHERGEFLVGILEEMCFNLKRELRLEAMKREKAEYMLLQLEEMLRKAQRDRMPSGSGGASGSGERSRQLIDGAAFDVEALRRKERRHKRKEQRELEKHLITYSHPELESSKNRNRDGDDRSVSSRHSRRSVGTAKSSKSRSGRKKATASTEMSPVSPTPLTDDSILSQQPEHQYQQQNTEATETVEFPNEEQLSPMAAPNRDKKHRSKRKARVAPVDTPCACSVM